MTLVAEGGIAGSRRCCAPRSAASYTSRIDEPTISVCVNQSEAARSTRSARSFARNVACSTCRGGSGASGRRNHPSAASRSAGSRVCFVLGCLPPPAVAMPSMRQPKAAVLDTRSRNCMYLRGVRGGA